MKISYLVSTYKSESFIDRRMRNLLVDQNDKNLEVIVVDSCSPENEKEIVEKWQSLFPEQVKYVRQPNRTPYGVSWLEAWKMATGTFVCNANTDDFCDPRFNFVVHKEFALARQKNQNVAFAYTGIQVINEAGTVLSRGIKPPFNFQDYSHTCWGGPALSWRNDQVFRDSVNWNLMTERAYQHTSAFDYWLALYFMSLGYHGHSIPDILTIYTQRPTSIENSSPKRNNYETYSSISEFFPHNFDSNLKHAKEFADFKNLPNKDEWIAKARKA